MFKDDDDEDDNTFGVTRYPCMPSLVALQQMRNRLHLANLGKKLMKWTALATGTELRNIAGQIDAIYKSFSQDIRDAFIALARCRYFYPHLNRMVVEGCPSVAEVVFSTSLRTTSGVKILKYHIIENNTHPYEHLGIDKGGQTIQETKRIWLELLKRMIMMIELRNNFKLVEEMHNTANKKMNVLGKVVIPKVKATMTYISSALDELARDEFYRRKMILEVKAKQKKKDKVDDKETEEECTLICDDDGNKKSMLTVLKEHVSEILEIVNTIDENNFSKSDIKEFMVMGEELKTKLEGTLNSEPFVSQPDDTDMENEELSLGPFEVEVKEITKIVRTRNPDGTIKEEKKIIKITKEVKDAVTGEVTNITCDPSTSSSAPSHNPTIQMISVKDWIGRKHLYDHKLFTKHIYGTTTEINSKRIVYDSLLFSNSLTEALLKLDKEYLKSRDYYANCSFYREEDVQLIKKNFYDICSNEFSCNEILEEHLSSLKTTDIDNITSNNRNESKDLELQSKIMLENIQDVQEKKSNESFVEY